MKRWFIKKTMFNAKVIAWSLAYFRMKKWILKKNWTIIENNLE